MTAPDWMTSATAKPSSPDGKAERIRARAEQDRLDAAAALELERGRLALERQKHAAKMSEKQERQHARTIARNKRAAAINKAIPTIGRRIMIVVPITLPMAVAWIGQIQFAQGTLHWILAGALVFAGGWELTTAFAGWMYHQARQDGDSGALFRAATWLFATSAGAMNYWHACPVGKDGTVHLAPTPTAVSYGAMSLVGIGLWELYSSLIHRKELRARKLMPAARPRFGFARWVRYPRVTWTAWSLSIHDQISTVEEAWAAAVTARRVKKARKSTNGELGPNEIRTTFASMALDHSRPVDQTTAESTPAPMVPDHPDEMVRTIDATVVRTTPAPPAETTPAAMERTTPEPAPRTTPKTTRKGGSKGGSKPARRTREQLREALEHAVAEHYRTTGGQIQVKPLAEQLKANRTTVRELLDEMNVRPIRREATG